MSYYIPTANEFSVELPFYLIDNLLLSSGEDLLDVYGNEEPMYSDIYQISLEGIDFQDGESVYILNCINTELNYAHITYISSFIFYKLVQVTELYEVLQVIYYKEFSVYELFTTQPKKVMLNKLPSSININYEGIELFSVNITHFSEIDNDSFEVDSEALISQFLDNNILNNL